MWPGQFLHSSGEVAAFALINLQHALLLQNIFTCMLPSHDLLLLTNTNLLARHFRQDKHLKESPQHCEDLQAMNFQDV